MEVWKDPIIHKDKPIKLPTIEINSPLKQNPVKKEEEIKIQQITTTNTTNNSTIEIKKEDVKIVQPTTLNVDKKNLDEDLDAWLYDNI